MKNSIVAFLFVLFLVSCSSDSDDPSGVVVVPDDAIAPKISYDTPSEVIETTSTFQISLEDASQVTTKIYLEDLLISESNAKSFSLEIDPFDYPSGDKTLKIVSTDSNGNESIEEINFELKKLLFSLPNPVSDYYLKDHFLTVHFNDGRLHKSVRIETDEDGDFYAEDGFERQDFTVTLFYITDDPRSNYNFIYSYANIKPGTVLLSYVEKYDQFNLGNLPAASVNIIDMNDITNPYIFGYNGHIRPDAQSSYVFNYYYEAERKYFLFSLPESDEIKTDYSYTVITDPERSQYSQEDLLKPEAFTQIRFPELPGSGLGIEGYTTEEDYAKNRYHVTLSMPGIWASKEYIDIPLFPDLFETYNLTFSYTPDDKTRFSSRQKGFDKQIPVNEFDVSKSGEKISISGDHDYSRFRLIYSVNDVNSSNLFQWTFHQRASQELALPMDSFEIPEEIAEIFEQRNIETKPSQINQWYNFEFYVYKHSESIIYENLFYGNNYLKNEAGDVSWLTYDLR
jgi:hypothetical protein